MATATKRKPAAKAARKAKPKSTARRKVPRTR
jgi:hypothetical protein